VRLLDRIYSSPGQLLEKAYHDQAILLRSLECGDELLLREALFNFCVTTYHIWDWVKAYRDDLRQPVSSLLDDSEALRACRDLCNASKHVKLSLQSRAYRDHPPVIEEVTMSVVGTTTPAGIDEFLGNFPENENSPLPAPPWRLKVQLKSRRRVPMEQLAEEAVQTWRRFFKEHEVS
jgi:hypothetical protein